MVPFISIIICTYNRSHLLARLLKSLANQTISQENYEVIVVDDGSSDNTRNICENIKEKILNFKYIFDEKNSGSGNARNKGLECARGDYILFTDDDCIVLENWIEKLSYYLTKEQIVAGSVISPVSNYLQLCHNIAQFHAYMPGRKAGYIDFIAGLNMGFRKEVLKDLNGFNKEQKLAVDTELIIRAKMKGYKIYFAPDVIVEHDPERTDLKEIFNYSYKHAGYTILLRNKYREILNTPFILTYPLMIIIFSPLIALKVAIETYLHSSYTRKFLWTFPVIYGLKLAWCWGAFTSLKKYKERS